MEQDNILIQFDHFNRLVRQAFNDPHTTLPEKITVIAHLYIDMITRYPDVTPFIITQARANPDELVSKMNVINEVNESVLASQIREHTGKNGRHIHPQHFIMNIISMCVFPLLAGNIIKRYGKLDDATYRAMMEERKTLITTWAMAMMNC